MTNQMLRELRTLLMLREGLRRLQEGKDLPDDPRDLLTSTTTKRK